MKKLQRKRGAAIKQTVVPPASKSYLQRALLAAALCETPVAIFGRNDCDDVLACADLLGLFGKKCVPTQNGYLVTDGPTKERGNCAESATALRLCLPAACALGKKAEFCGQGRLMRRPHAPLLNVLSRNGVDVTATAESVCVKGSLQAGRYEMDGDVSSQFVSGLLFALPLLNAPSTLVLTTPLQSQGYVAMTLETLRAFGIVLRQTENGFDVPAPQKYFAETFRCEEDASSAAVWLAYGALADGATVRLPRNTLQPDAAIVSFLGRAGVDVRRTGEDCTVLAASPHGFCADVSQCPDLAPTLAAFCACAEGQSVLTGLQRLKYKESDRLCGICEMLRACKVPFECKEDRLFVKGGKVFPAVVDVKGDHRFVAMAAILSARTEITLQEANVVSKSDPYFWQTFRMLGGEDVDLGK